MAEVEGNVMEIYLNDSDTIAVIFPGNGSGIASLITQDVKGDLAFQMSTFGARASCTSHNAFCSLPSASLTNDVVVFGVCPGAPSGFPAVKNWRSDQTQSSSGWSPIVSFPSSPFNNHTVVDFIDLLGYPINITQPGPYTLWLQLWWNSLDAFTQHNLSGVFSVPVDSIGVALAMCNVSYRIPTSL